jgi:DNA replication protein DnaC
MMTDRSDDTPRELAAAVDRVYQGLGGLTGKRELGAKNIECPEHGAFSSTGVAYRLGRTEREIWSRCPACMAREQEEERAEAERQAAERRERQMAEQMGEANIPARFRLRTLQNFKAANPGQVAALEISREYAESFEQRALKRGDSLIFLGAPGTGKSHLATAILQAILPKHCGLYTTTSAIIRAWRDTWRKESELSERQLLKTYAELPLLVIDEVGVQRGTEDEKNTMFDILDRRYRDMKPTILLANQTKEQLAEILGERVFDRLRETARIVSFQWESYRPVARREAA